MEYLFLTLVVIYYWVMAVLCCKVAKNGVDYFTTLMLWWGVGGPCMMLVSHFFVPQYWLWFVCVLVGIPIVGLVLVMLDLLYYGLRKWVREHCPLCARSNHD